MGLNDIFREKQKVDKSRPVPGHGRDNYSTLAQNQLHDYNEW